MKNTLHALAACMAIALAIQVPATPTASPQGSVEPTPVTDGGTETVALSPATLDAVTGAINWPLIACLTSAAVLVVGASLAASPGIGAVASATLAAFCRARY